MDAAMVESAIEILLGHPEAEQEEIRSLLAGAGLSPQEAWRAYQFLPIAFVHVVMRSAGVQFQPGYILWDPDTDAKSTHNLADEPLYLAGAASAERRIVNGNTIQQLFPVFARSAEYNVICDLAGPNGQVAGIVLVEPMLMTFGGDKHREQECFS